MPNATTKHNMKYTDPGGDPAATQGGVVEVTGVIVSTQQSGWRQALITKGVAS